MTKVMIFGTFDGLHRGHLHLLKEAAKLGDELVVLVSQDKTVQTVKNKEVMHTMQERIEIVSALRCVDYAVPGSNTDVYEPIQEHKPDIIALGYDQQAFVDKLEQKIEEFDLRTRIVRLDAYKHSELKTSILRQKLEKQI